MVMLDQQGGKPPSQRPQRPHMSALPSPSSSNFNIYIKAGGNPTIKADLMRRLITFCWCHYYHHYPGIHSLPEHSSLSLNEETIASGSVSSISSSH